jgi:hypothetical protein
MSLYLDIRVKVLQRSIVKGEAVKHGPQPRTNRSGHPKHTPLSCATALPSQQGGKDTTSSQEVDTMTPPQRENDRMDRAAFRTELERLVARAQEDGVEVGGGYNVRSPDPDVPDYTIEITEQEKRITDGGVDSVSADGAMPTDGTAPTDMTAPTDVVPSNGGGLTVERQRRAVDRFLLAPPF